MRVLRDPVARLITVGCISFGALGHTPLRYVAVVAGGYACWTVAAGIPPRTILRGLRRALLFLGLIVFVNGITRSGRVVFETGGMYITAEGLAAGFEQAFRLALVLWGALLLVSGGALEEYQDAAERWTSRKGRPLVAAWTIAIAYLPLLVESARRVRIARRARGEDDRPGFTGTITHVAGAALPLLAAALRNADALAEAMESRCYAPSRARTRFHPVPVAAPDVIAVIAVSLFTTASLTGIT
ncbi:MAG TPA: CbiQ family ECF transporter T component [Bacteroidota bacterium]|nr:CbiQ family ECF transporter T component [Bacteroidota bacterium]